MKKLILLLVPVFIHGSNFVFSNNALKSAWHAAIKKADELGRAGTLVICDKNGELVFIYRQQGAFPSTKDFSEAKAKTVARLGIPTNAWQTCTSSGACNATTKKLTTKPNVPYPGGFPITVKSRGSSEFVGSIAFGSTDKKLDANVGGTHPNADVEIAQAALNALKNPKNNVSFVSTANDPNQDIPQKLIHSPNFLITKWSNASNANGAVVVADKHGAIVFLARTEKGSATDTMSAIKKAQTVAKLGFSTEELASTSVPSPIKDALIKGGCTDKIGGTVINEGGTKFLGALGIS